jgi:hypothetical protein
LVLISDTIQKCRDNKFGAKKFVDGNKIANLVPKAQKIKMENNRNTAKAANQIAP